jgi:hypothetical protein
MNIFGFQLAVKKFVKWNTINFLNYVLILRRSVVTFEIFAHVNFPVPLYFFF